MAARPIAQQKATSPAAAKLPARRWLLLVHQLPSKASNLRVRTWRRLQQLGAVPVKQAVYVLPDSPSAREDFEWIKAEITAAGGDASVFVADSVDAWSDDALVEEFRRSRQESYSALAREVEAVLGKLNVTRRPRGTRAPAVRRLVGVFIQRLAAIEHIDFFGSAGRDRVSTLVNQLAATSADSSRPVVSKAGQGKLDARNYVGRVWVTRPRPGVDRMASAWLIQRFVDPQAQFSFAADRESLPQAVIAFDMFGVEFSHQGDRCTFETLCSVFDIQEPTLDRVAAIVHDLDLKDGRFGPPEAETIGTVIEGLQLAERDDHELLRQGISLFEALYKAFEQSVRVSKPRPVARPGKRNRPRKRRRS